MNHRDIVEHNLERLLGAAYKPEAPDPAFVKTLEAKMLLTAKEHAERRPIHTAELHPVRKGVETQRLRSLRRGLAWGMAAAASVAICGLVFYGLRPRADRPGPFTGQHRDSIDIKGQPVKAPTWAEELANGLRPKSRPAETPAKPLAVGETLKTKAGQRRRVALADGSLLYLNQNTEVTQTAARQLNLSAGEIYLEVAPRESRQGATFEVKTPQRLLSALGTRFGVQADRAGTGVVVTQGKVKVSGLDRVVEAGQQMAPGDEEITPAPRASHVLDWTRELMAAAESPLVPCSKHAGGALVALDPNGQEIQLTLRKYHIDVHVEDGFARTTIDQTYFNNTWGRLEGTFYFPLPPDGVLSRLAMYVEDGSECKLNEGGMAEREHARNVYETILHTRRDPALLEWVDGSTFKMRVFPLEGRKEKRIILSYTQRLSSLYGATRYRFAAGHNMELVRDWSFAARVKHAAELRVTSDSHPNMAIAPQGGDMVLSLADKAIKPNQDVTVEVYDNAAARAKDAARFATYLHEGAQYLMLRYRPALPSEPKRERRDWVFLFESAANRDPLLARAQIEVVRTLLENAEHDDTFTVLTAATRTHLWSDKLRAVNKENIDKAIEFLDGAHLIGALDLEKALDAAKTALKSAKNPHLVHVGAGVAALGERGDDKLAARIPEGTRYVGIGVGKRWNRAFMKMAADRSGGYFTQINPDESISWRAFELLSTLNTPRLLELRVVDNAEKVTFLTETASLAQGEELCAFTRIDAKGALPEKVTISGKVNGKPFTRELAVKDVAPNAGYIPRAWAKLEIDRLLADGADKNKQAIVALSMKSYVMSPFTSLLVLETDADYERFKVDRGRKDHWALYACPDRIPLVYEPENKQVEAPAAKPGAKRKPEEVLQTIIVRMPPRVLHLPNRPQHHVPPAVTALHLYYGAYALMLDDLAEAGGWTDLWESREMGEWKRTERLTEFDFLGRFANQNEALRRLEMFERLEPLLKGQGTATEWGARDRAFKRLDLGRRIHFAPVFVSPTMQWSVPSSSLTGPPLALMPWAREPMGEGEGRFDAWARLPRFWAGDMDELLPPPFGQGGPPLNLEHANSIEFFPPSLALIVRGKARMHTGITRGFVGGKRDPRGWMMSDLTPAAAFMPDLERSLKDLPLDEKKKAKRDYYLGHLTGRMLRGQGSPSLLYERPTFTADNRIFGDLTLYAPGLNTTAADIQAVLATETEADKAITPGAIDPAARKLIDKARGAGWQQITLPGAEKSQIQVTFDGTGRFAYEHRLSSGLKEVVACDGSTLLHLYPEIGLGARRKVSRFHHSELAGMVPWLLPPVEELARGADVKAIGDRTIALIPHGQPAKDKEGKPLPTWQTYLVFGDDGDLVERQLVKMPAGKVLARETYESGTVRLHDPAKDKVVSEEKLALRPAEAPDLKPRVAELVVLSFPLRTAQGVLPSGWDGDPKKLDHDRAIALFAANCLHSNPSYALQIFGERFHAQGDRRIGFYTLMAASGATIALKTEHQWSSKVSFDPETEHPKNPLAKYLAHHFHIMHHGGYHEMPLLAGPQEGLVQRLGEFRDLWLRWQHAKEDNAALRERAGRFLRHNPSPVFAWAMVDSLQRRNTTGDAELARKIIAELRLDKDDGLGLVYAARYENARSLLNQNNLKEARKQFRELYAEAAKEGGIPLIDSDFRRALQAQNEGEQPFAELIRHTAAELLKKKEPTRALLLAWQIWQLGEQPLADELFTAIQNGVSGDAKEALQLAGLEFLLQTNQFARADTLLQKLLQDKKFAERPLAWRLAFSVAQRRGMTARAVAYLEKALDLEYKTLPEMVNLQTVRNDYQGLLGQYQQLASALTMLETEPPKDFLAKVVRAADRWRSLDSDASSVCQLTSKILQTLGAKELAWDYLTTPIGLKPNEAAPWLGMAQTLRQDADFELADRAYANAFQAEPTNAQILWDRAQNLQQMGRTDDARSLFRQLADGDWQPRFQWMRDQARAFLSR